MSYGLDMSTNFMQNAVFIISLTTLYVAGCELLMNFNDFIMIFFFACLIKTMK